MYLVKFTDNSEAAVDIRQSHTRRGRWEAHMPNGQILVLTMKGRDNTGNYVIAIDGIDTSISLHPCADGYELTVDDYSERVTVSRAAEVVFEESSTDSPSTINENATPQLLSPITGIVLDVFVTPNQNVSPGQPVILIEAMKMENTLEAPANYLVQEIFVSAGDTVFVGDPLVQYAPPPSPS